MAQSLANILIHLVFSTKNREPTLLNGERDELHAYITGILHNHNCHLIEINSIEDHIHILLALTKTESLARIVEQIKTHSALWLKDKPSAYTAFAWQRGYGAFSVSPTHAERVRLYIRNQREHHAKVDYMTEFRRICVRNLTPLDERYAWD